MTSISRVLIVMAMSMFAVFAVAVMIKAPSVLAQNYTDPENQKMLTHWKIDVLIVFIVKRIHLYVEYQTPTN